MRILTTLLLSAIILGVGVGGFMLFGKAPEVAQNAENTDFRPLVKTVSVVEHNQPVVIEMDGEANSFRVITVGSQVKGQIKERRANARNGMYVNEGDVLFEIDSTNYTLEIERLNAQLAQTEEEIVSVEVDIENVKELIVLAEQDWGLQKKQLQRVRDAYKQNSFAESEVDSATRQELTARNALQTLKNSKRSQEQLLKQKHASKKLVQAQLKQAHVNLERCQVKAPVSGRIVNDLAEQGDFVKEGDQLVMISDSSQIDVKCNLQADELFWILQQLAVTPERIQQLAADPLANPIPCEVVYEFEGSEVIWDGLLSRFEGTGIDRDTRTFPCRVNVAEPTNYRLENSQGGRMLIAPSLASGMYVTVRIPLDVSSPLLRMPTEAVRPGGDVWVVREGKLQVRNVSIAQSLDEEVLIRANETDLAPGDEVIVTPLVAARDGMDVRQEDEE